MIHLKRHLSAAIRKLPPAGWAALALLAVLTIVYLRAPRAPSQDQPLSISQRLAHEQCVHGAILFHDVRWAAACAVLAEQGQGNGHADCELPDAQAERLYGWLQRAERKCLAEVKAAPAR